MDAQVSPMELGNPLLKGYNLERCVILGNSATPSILRRNNAFLSI